MSAEQNSALATAVWCAGASLGAEPSALIRDEKPSPSPQIAQAIMTHRISKLATDNVNRLGLEEGDAERVRNDALAHTHAAFQLIGHTDTVVKLLSAESVRFLIIKGIALGALSQTAAGRGAGDVDVLIDPADLPRVHDIFLANGYRTALALPDVARPATRRVWQYIEREASYVQGPIHIDLHWRISTQRHLFPPFDELYSRHSTLAVSNTALPTLSAPDSLAAACYHAYFDEFQPLRSMLDVVALLNVVDPTELPAYSPQLQQLLSGVVSLSAELFPGVVDDAARAVTERLAPPPGVVRERFDQALQHSRAPWGTRPTYRAQLRKARAEAHFDTLLDSVPRFLGRRLVRFEPWTPARPTMSFSHAFANRMSIELSGARRALSKKRVAPGR